MHSLAYVAHLLERRIQERKNAQSSLEAIKWRKIRYTFGLKPTLATPEALYNEYGFILETPNTSPVNTPLTAAASTTFFVHINCSTCLVDERPEITI